jgi:hypothetical protein
MAQRVQLEKEKAGNLGRYQIIGEQILEETSAEYE